VQEHAAATHVTGGVDGRAIEERNDAVTERKNGMGAMERKNLALIRAHLRSLERQGVVVSSLDGDGQVRWRITEKGRREDSNEMDSRLDWTPKTVRRCRS
jgi:hypothetical protein